MSENTQVDQSVEKPQDQTIESKPEEHNNWTVQQLTERLKVVNASDKDNRKKLVEEKKKREELEKKVLAESGQYKELAEVWQRKAEQAEQTSLRLKEAFAIKSISDSVSIEAQKLGCVDPEALINLINLNDLPLDDSFNVDKSHVKVVLEDMRKQKPYFFKAQSPKFIDANPGKVEKSQGKPIDQMSSEEIQKLLKEKYKK